MKRKVPQENNEVKRVDELRENMKAINRLIQKECEKENINISKVNYLCSVLKQLAEIRCKCPLEFFTVVDSGEQ